MKWHHVVMPPHDAISMLTGFATEFVQRKFTKNIRIFEYNKYSVALKLLQMTGTLKLPYLNKLTTNYKLVFYREDGKYNLDLLNPLPLFARLGFMPHVGLKPPVGVKIIKENFSFKVTL